MPPSPESSPRLWLDQANERVLLGERPLRLTPKAFAVLRHLMGQPGRLATKEELMAAVWPDTAVTDGSLSTCIREIRRVLDDDPAAPRYIQTVHRRGYCYVGEGLAPETAAACDGDLLVGRARELDFLDRALRQVDAGGRRLVFLGGESGIGKTTLVEHFLDRASASATALASGRATRQIARGQCVEQYGLCEAYLPWFDALNHLARDGDQDRVVSVLRRYAPMWLAQLPWLIEAGERHRLQHEIANASRERMIRELAEALEALSADETLIVALEDLHWSDPSSIGLLSYLARRQRPARLLLLGTYRPGELYGSSAHPLIALKHELLLHGNCDDVRLDFLTREAVAEYVASRVPGASNTLALDVHQATDGNPLFMVNVIDDLRARGVMIAPIEIPVSLKDLIARQLSRLSPDDRRLLEAASVAGASFCAATVAAALEEPAESAEERLGLLARRGTFIRDGERRAWPNGTQSDGYAFIHALYQNVLYDQIGTTRRSRMHRQTGECLETAYSDRVEEIAAELALHFLRGHDPRSAVSYLTLAGENAIRRNAFVEAIALLTQGLGLLPLLPEGTDRDAREVRLRVPLGVSYISTRGYAAPEVGATFERAYSLCRIVNDPERLFRVLRGVWLFAAQRADLRRARALADELLQLAGRQRDVVGLVEGHRIMATTLFHLGMFAEALDHVDRGLELYDPVEHSSRAFIYVQDPGVCCHAWRAWALWYLGYPDQAAISAQRSVELARQIGHPFSLSYAVNFAARLHLHRGEAGLAQEYADEAVTLTRDQGLTPMLAVGQILRGSSGTVLGHGDEAIRDLADGVRLWRSTGAVLVTPYWMYLHAEALDRVGRLLEAYGVLNEALLAAERSEERWFECEIYILKASLFARVRGALPGRDPRVIARTDLHHAYHAATEMESPSLRLRAANALSPLLREQGHLREARDLICDAYETFKEGFQTADLADAQAMLGE